MSNRRTIWLVAGGVVLVAAIVVLVREANGPRREDAPELVNTMMTLLEQDPRLDTAETKQAVKDVADLVEQGRLDTAQGHYALGLHRCEQRSFDAAERAFRRAMALEPEWA